MNNIVRIDDKLIYQGSYKLSAKATKIMFYVIAKYINPRDDRQSLPIINIPLKEIAEAITETDSEKKYNWSGSLYESIDAVCVELSSTQIKFPSNVKVDGIRLKGYINLCSVMPEEINGEKYLSFGFDPFMSQFLFGLTKYVLTYRPEVNRLKSGYSIRLFQMLKGLARKKAKFGATVFREVYSVDNLRYLFEIEEAKAYKEFKNFNRLIIKKSVAEINSNTTIRVMEINKMRRGGGRAVTHLEFVFTEQQPMEKLKYLNPINSSDYVPSEEDLDILTRAEHQAYLLLTGFGVKEGIAYRKILPEIKGSESEGFEDYFIGFCLDHFKKWSNAPTNTEKAAATFVNWWTKRNIFDTTSDVWSKINERVIEKKKNLAKKNRSAYDNRFTAREMTRLEFAAWWREQETKSPTPSKASKSETKKESSFEGIADILANLNLSFPKS